MQCLTLDRQANNIGETLTRKPASANQVRYIKAELSGVGSYMMMLGYRVEGQVDLERLQKAFSEVVLRHDCLRTRFAIEEHRIWAEVSNLPKFQFQNLTLVDPSLEHFREHALPNVFDRVDPMEAGSLLRLIVAQSEESWRFTIARHHAISDGISANLLVSELTEIYTGKTLDPAPSYYDYAILPKDNLEPKIEQQLSNIVANFPALQRVPADGFAPDVDSRKGVFIVRQLDHQPEVLKTTAKKCGATRFGLLGALYALALSNFTGTTKPTSFFQSAGRRSTNAPSSIAGPFSNTLPLDLSFDPHGSFCDLACEITDRVKAMLDLEDTDLLDRMIACGKAPKVSLNMFPTAANDRFGGLPVGPREFLDRQTEFDINLVWGEDRGRLSVYVFYDERRLSRERSELFLDLIEGLLNKIVIGPERSCGDLQKAVCHDKYLSPSLEIKLYSNRSIDHDFFAVSTQRPNDPAIITSNETIDYHELQSWALRYTAALKDLDVQPEQPVAIVAERGPQMIAAMLGVLAAGASFAVIDIKYPDERISKFIELLGAKFIIDAAGLSDKQERILVGLGLVVPANEPAAIPEQHSQRMIAYHLFTSGTTGQPKRVSHPDATLLRFVDWQSKTLAFADEVPFRTAMIAGLSHDPILRDIFLPLLTGGSLVIPTSEQLTAPSEIRDLIDSSETNVLHLTPSTGRLICIGAPPDQRLNSLRAIFWGGDSLDGNTIQTWWHRASLARQFNLYGTSETPQAALIHEISEDNTLYQRIPIGNPLPWMKVEVQAPDGTVAAPGALGEIVVDLPDPVIGAKASGTSDPSELPVSRHHTGDLGFYLPSAGIYFAGRRDNQVKVNSIRVDLEEIAASALALPGVRDAKVILHGNETQHIILFVVGPEQVEVDQIETALQLALPHYMLPKQIVAIDQLPLNANGKIDCKELINVLDQLPVGPAQPSVAAAPTTELEEEIAGTYSQLTGQQVTDRHLSLVDIGADSLSAIEARIALEERLGILPEGWEYVSIAELAAKYSTTRENFENASKTKPANWFLSLLKPIRLESFIILRTLAIIYIVARHCGALGEFIIGGGSHMLIALAGFGFARLQLPSILKDGRTGRVLALIAKLMIPLIPASLLIFAVHTYLGHQPHLSAITLFENLSPFVEQALIGRTDHQHHIEWLWFLHVYVQMFAIIAVVVVFRAPRQMASADPWQAMIVFFAIMEVVAVATVVAMAAATGGSIQETGFLLRRSPTSLLPLLILGSIFAFADTSERKKLSLFAAAIHLGLSMIILQGGENGLWLATLMILLAFPYLSVPNLIYGTIIAISAHALLIYLSHRAIGFAWTKIVDFETHPWLLVTVELAGGVVLGTILVSFLHRLGLQKLARLRLST